MSQINYLEEENIILPRNIFKLIRTSSVGEIKTYAGPGNEGLHLLKWINKQIELGNITVVTGSGDFQEKIQFKDEGTNLGTSGTVEQINFVGGGVTATRVGDVLTITVPETVVEQLIQFQNEGNNLGNPEDIEIIDFVGSGVNASISGNKITVTINGSDGSSLFEYDATDGVRVIATSLGVTASWSSGTLTIDIPDDTLVLSARVSLSNGSNVQSSADGGGATNWIKVVFNNTLDYNTSVSDMKVPSIQKCFYASGNPSVSNAYSIDIDNNPNMAIVGVGSNSISIRIWNLIVPNGAQFTFNGI